MILKHLQLILQNNDLSNLLNDQAFIEKLQQMHLAIDEFYSRNKKIIAELSKAADEKDKKQQRKGNALSIIGVLMIFLSPIPALFIQELIMNKMPLLIKSKLLQKVIIAGSFIGMTIFVILEAGLLTYGMTTSFRASENFHKERTQYKLHSLITIFADDAFILNQAANMANNLEQAMELIPEAVKKKQHPNILEHALRDIITFDMKKPADLPDQISAAVDGLANLQYASNTKLAIKALVKASGIKDEKQQKLFKDVLLDACSLHAIKEYKKAQKQPIGITGL